jgi:hypothetical protein
MNHLKYLEFQRLMKELQFVESDYLFQSEIMRLSDVEFFKSVDSILTQFPQLKEIYNRKQDEQFQKIIHQSISETIEIKETKSNKLELPEAKKIYRDIAKATHPDKIKNIKLNELYLEATEAYEQNDLVTLYKVCSELNIEFELPDDFISQVKNKIDSYREQVSFLENTYTYKWIKSEDDTKNKVVVEFIRSKISLR